MISVSLFQILFSVRMSNSTEEELRILSEKIMNFGKTVENLERENDKFFLVVIAIIIFFMQCGFAFLEAGSVQ